MNAYRAASLASKSMFSSRAVKISLLSAAGGLFLINPASANDLPELSTQAASRNRLSNASTSGVSLPA